MKTLRVLILFLLASLLVTFAPRTARADDGVSMDSFYESLSPFGEWIKVADYGLCWRPNGVNEDWAPYTDGYWSYTDSGWTWVSYEDFGGIVYHYGRWVHVRGEGWCWVPDTDWGPAWVSWRNNDDYVGWAPLPPEAHFTASIGFSTWVDDTYDIGPGYYRFCHVRDFGAPVISEVCLPRERNITFISETVNVTNITVVSGGVPFCGGPRYDFIAARVIRPIPALRLVRDTSINSFAAGDHRHGFAAIQRGNTLVVHAPHIRPPADPRNAFANVRPSRVVAAGEVTHGWDAVKNENDRTQLRQALRQQNKGATAENAPAKPIAPAELKPLPAKADPNAKSPVAITRNRPTPGAVTVPPGSPAPTTTAPTTTTAPAATPVIARGKRGKKGAGTPVPSAAAPAANVPPGTVERPPVDRTITPGATPKAITKVPGAPRAPATSNAPIQPFRPPTAETSVENPVQPAVTPMPKRGKTPPGSAAANPNSAAAAAAAETHRQQAEAARAQADMQKAQAAAAKRQTDAAHPPAQPKPKAVDTQKQMEQAARQQQSREQAAAAAESQKASAAAAANQRAAAAAAANQKAAAAAAQQRAAQAARPPQAQPQPKHAPQPAAARPGQPAATATPKKK